MRAGGQSSITLICSKGSFFEYYIQKTLFEIISKQTQIILGVDNVNEAIVEPQSDYARQIERIGDDRLKLYERYVHREIAADEYKTAKAHPDEEFSRLTQIHTALSTAQSANRERKKIAGQAAIENTLTRPLVDLLIEKVLIYPKEKFEVTWKVKIFFADRHN